MTRVALLLGGCALLVIAGPALPVPLAPAPAVAQTGGAGSFSTFVLGPDGVVYSWRAGDAVLSPLPSSLARLAGHPVNDLAISGNGGAAIVLPVSTPEAEARHRRHAGSAVVISSPTPAAPPAILNEITFEGDGRRVAVSQDGRFAYVLAILTGTVVNTGEVARARLHALDLVEGRVLASAQLDRPPSAIALDPTGTRLYLAYTGRILSYTAHPLAQSWHYRSPGANRGLFFSPRGAVLYSMRLNQIAMFDPEVIAARKPGQRQKLEDDATAVVPLPLTADSLLFSQDGLLAVAYGPGSGLGFLAPGAGRMIAASADGAGLEADQELRPFYFGPGPGDLIVGTFPDRRVRTIHPPSIPAGEPTVEPVPVQEQKLSEGLPSISGAESAVPASAATTTPGATPTPAPTLLFDQPSVSAPVLAGRLSGRIDAVRAIVVYGPGSIVREQTRAAPAADGSWRIPLPLPGSYRIVPVGEGSRPLRSEPNFHTLDVADKGRTDLDFKILGTN